MVAWWSFSVNKEVWSPLSMKIWAFEEQRWAEDFVAPSTNVWWESLKCFKIIFFKERLKGIGKCSHLQWNHKEFPCVKTASVRWTPVTSEASLHQWPLVINTWYNHMGDRLLETTCYQARQYRGTHAKNKSSIFQEVSSSTSTMYCIVVRRIRIPDKFWGKKLAQRDQDQRRNGSFWSLSGKSAKVRPFDGLETVGKSDLHICDGNIRAGRGTLTFQSNIWWSGSARL